MFQKNTENTNFYNFDGLSVINNLIHFSTTREGGVCTGVYKSFNLSYSTKDHSENIKTNRERLAKLLKTDIYHVIFPKQTHSDVVRIIDLLFLKQTHTDQENQLSGVDALITKEKGICICILTADCVPVFLFDPIKQVAAVVHAGWRGTVNSIVLKTIVKMQHEFGCNPNDILAGIGPSIGPNSYEIGNEVAEEFVKVYPNDMDKIVTKKIIGKYHLNLWEANRIQLLKSGLQEKNIETSGICTFENDSVFYSSRKNNGDTGRFANGMMML